MAKVVQGHLNKEIADQLNLALVTVKVYRGRAMKKLRSEITDKDHRLAGLERELAGKKTQENLITIDLERVKNQLVCPTHGPISRDEIEKGYAYEKDSYVIISQEDLEGIRLESNKTIELVQFVDADEIDALYFNAPYYLGPDGPVAEEAFRVIREAMEELLVRLA